MTGQVIQVTLAQSGDKPRDCLRVRRIVGAAESYPGDDRLLLLIMLPDSQVAIGWPDISTDAQALESHLINQKISRAPAVTIAK